MSEDEVYTVQEILGKRVQDGVEEYFIKWDGYGSDDNTWEVRGHLCGVSTNFAYLL